MARTTPLRLMSGCAAAIGVAAWLAACTGLEPAALSAGASVAQTGVTIFDRGKARTIERADFDDAVAAIRRATSKLSLKQTVEDPTPGRLRMSFHDERGQSIVIVVERRTQTVTMLQADVGALGEIGWATLVLNQAVAELTIAGSLPPPPLPPANQPREPDVLPPAPPAPAGSPTAPAASGDAPVQSGQ